MKRTLAGIIVTGVFVSAGAWAEPATNKPAVTTVAAGLNLAKGNSDNLQANLTVAREGETVRIGAYKLGLQGNYGESTVADVTSKSVQNTTATAGTKKPINDSIYVYGESKWFNDVIAEVDYRLTLGPGLGHYLIKNDKTKLSIEAGAAYITEKVAEAKNDFGTYRVAEDLDYKFAATSRLWQKVEYLPEFEDFSSSLLSGEIGVEAMLTGKMNLRVVVQDKYDSTPAEGLKNNDLAVIAGLSTTL